MFVGHLAVGLALRRLVPRQSLGVLMAAPMLADVLWPLFVLAGVERFAIVPHATGSNHFVFEHYPWSHSLALLAVWGVLAGAAVLLLTRDRRGALVVSGGVVSHWLLDWIVHVPDMPLWPGSARFGLSLWNQPWITVGLELVLFLGAAAWYAAGTRPRGRAGAVGLWAFVLLVSAAFLVGPVSPPPPGVRTVAVMALILAVLLVTLSAWFDRHREVA